MVKKKAKSHRQTLKQKYKVQKRVKEHDRKLKKAQKRGGLPLMLLCEMIDDEAERVTSLCLDRRRDRARNRALEQLLMCLVVRPV